MGRNSQNLSVQFGLWYRILGNRGVEYLPASIHLNSEDIAEVNRGVTPLSLAAHTMHNHVYGLTETEGWGIQTQMGWEVFQNENLVKKFVDGLDSDG